MLRRYINFMKKHPLITAAIAIAYAVICLKSLPTATFFQSLVVRTLLCDAMGYWLFALPLGIFVLLLSANDPVCDNVPLQMLTVFLMFVFGGLFEELAFRAVINDGIELLILWGVWRKVGRKIDFQEMRETW